MATKPTEPQDYRYLRAWLKLTGSKPYYITDQVRRAREAGAPDDAVYQQIGVLFDPEEHAGADWVRIGDVDQHVQASIYQALGEMQTAPAAGTKAPQHRPLEGKYGRIHTERPTTWYEAEPVFLFRAQDRLAPNAVWHYYETLQKHELPQAIEVYAAWRRMVDWQSEHPEAVKLPD